MRFITLTISLILTLNISAQFRDSIDFKYKKLNIPLVTSLDMGDQFSFFSSDNLLWFSTKQGLTSFDGIEIQNYYPDTSKSIKYGLSKIMAMAEDKDKNLWIAALPFNYTSLLYFDRRSKTITKIDTSITKGIFSQRLIKEMIIDDNGLLWMSTNEKGFYVFNPTGNTFEYYEIAKTGSDDFILWFAGIYMSPHFTDPDKMWLCIKDGIYLFSLEGKKAELKYTFPKNDSALARIRYMDAANDSILFIGMLDGMGVYNTKRNVLTMNSHYTTLKEGARPYPTLERDLYPALFSVAKKSAYEYYVQYFNSLPLIFNYHTQKYTQLNNPDLKKEFKRWHVKLLVDKQDNLWVGESKCLYVISSEFNLFHLSEFDLFHLKVSPNVNYFKWGYYSFVWDKALKKYYVAFYDHQQVYQFDSAFQFIKNMSTPFPRRSDIILSQDPAKNIWALQLMTAGSLSICKRGNDYFEPIEKIHPQLSSLNKMVNMTANSNDTLIFSNANRDLFFLNTKTLKLDSLAFPRIDSRKQFEDIWPTFTYDSISKCVYVSNGKNIWQYNLETKASKAFIWDSTLPFKKADVISMSIYAPGQLLVQAYDGSSREFYIYDQQAFGFKRKIKFTDPRIEISSRLQIFQGPKPYIFFMHDEGTTLYNYDDSSFRLLDKNNGLLSNLPTQRFGNFTDNIYFSGNLSSFQYVNFDRLISLQNQRTPLINRLAAYAKNTILLPDLSNGKIELNYDQNTIGVSFSAIEYLFPEKVQYSFRLSELHSDWRYADYKSREILYSNLSPGKYTFQLKA